MSDRVIATFDNYRDAERAVDHLSDSKFPVERVSIVGRDLKTVEQVVGRMTLLRATANGALSGALAGGLIGWLFAVFDWFDPVVSRGWLILDGIWFGALIGALFGLIAHALTRGRRDFTSVAAMQAEQYDVVTDDEVADEAARLLSGIGVTTARREDPRFARDPEASAPRASASAPRTER
jgi:uncharacterized membrane protein